MIKKFLEKHPELNEKCGALFKNKSWVNFKFKNGAFNSANSILDPFELGEYLHDNKKRRVMIISEDELTCVNMKEVVSWTICSCEEEVDEPFDELK